MVAARRMFAVHWESERTGIPVEEIAGRLTRAGARPAAVRPAASSSRREPA